MLSLCKGWGKNNYYALSVGGAREEGTGGREGGVRE